MHLHNTPTKVILEIPLESALSFIPSLVFWKTTFRREGERSIHPFIRTSMSPDVSDVDYSAMYPPIDHKEKKTRTDKFFANRYNNAGLPRAMHCFKTRIVRHSNVYNDLATGHMRKCTSNSRNCGFRWNTLQLPNGDRGECTPGGV